MAMISEEKKYYLCQYFRVAYLLRILLCDTLFRNKKVIIYYLKPNRLTIFITKFNRLFSKISAYKIMIEELPEKSASICNYLTGTFYQKAGIDRLYEIMHRIDKEILQSKQSLLNFLNNKFSPLKGSLRLYIKHEITFDIREALLLVETAGRLFGNPQSMLYRTNSTLFIDINNYWTKYVFEYANGEGISCIGVDKFKLRRNKAAQLIFYVIKLFIEYIGSFFIYEKLQSENVTNKIGIPYYFHKNFTEFFDRRNYYLFWYPESGIDPQRIIIYSDGNMDIPPEEKKKMKNLGFRLLCCNAHFKNGINLAPKYKCSFKAIRLFFSYVKQLLKLLFRIRSRLAFEEWKILAVLFFRLPYWEDFFSNNNIKVKFRFHDIFSHREIAANLTGAATISYNYSNHAPDTFNILHQDICDIYFVWGKRYQRCILKEHSDIKNIVHTGYIFDYTFNNMLIDKKVDWLRKSFIHNNKNFVIAFLDEALCIYSPYKENILNLYRLIFKFLSDNPDIGLIIKPKEKDTRDLLKSSEKTFSSLEKEGRIKVLDSLKYPVEAGKASDLVIGVHADSTAALECSLAGIPVIIYECYSGEQESNLYYKHGKNKIIFYDFQTMTDAIQRYRMSRDRSNGFADWSGLLKEIDSFRDGKANRRFGFYIKTLLEGFDSGLTKNAAIRESNRVYADRFGRDTVTSLR